MEAQDGNVEQQGSVPPLPSDGGEEGVEDAAAAAAGEEAVAGLDAAGGHAAEVHGDDKDEDEEDDDVDGDEEDEAGPSNGNRRRKPSYPSILKELNLRVASNGIILPESRKSYLRRRREAREKGLLPPAPPPGVLAELEAQKGGRNKKKKRARQRPMLATGPLEDAAADLFRSAFSGDAEGCSTAIAEGADVNVRTNADIDGMGKAGSALHIAASRGHEEVVSILLEARADPQAVTGRGETPVQLATRGGQVGVVKLLREVGGAPQDIAGTKRLLDKAPAWDDRKRRKLHAVLAPKLEWKRSGAKWGKPEENATQLPGEAPAAEGQAEWGNKRWREDAEKDRGWNQDYVALPALPGPGDRGWNQDYVALPALPGPGDGSGQAEDGSNRNRRGRKPGPGKHGRPKGGKGQSKGKGGKAK